MAVALVATFYGIVLANFVFTPIAENLTKQSKEDLVARRMVIEGIMLIAADMPTRFIEEQVLSYLLPSERGDGKAGSKAGSGASGRKAA
jgi:chemotaxis protein MotA